MKPNRTIIFAGLFITLFAFADDTKPIISKSPMDVDQLAVYQAFLNSYNNGSKAKLNLSKLTSTFNLVEEKKDSCLKGIDFDAESQPNSVVHEFDQQIILLEKNIQLWILRSNIRPSKKVTRIMLFAGAKM
jgi:hypothetical protein